MIKYILICTLFLTITLQARMIHSIVDEQRVALVIGNSNYTSLAPLKNPINDARLIRDQLKKRGFTVIYKEDATKKEMRNLLKKFSHKITKGGVGFYYFGGHSINIDGKINLTGIDSSIGNREYMAYETVVLNNIIKKMRNAHNRLNIIVLDTCRNIIKSNIYGTHHSSRGVHGGLTPLSNTRDIFIASATVNGEVARDGKEGSYGILTKYLVSNFNKEGSTIRDIFEHTKQDIYTYINVQRPQSTYDQIKGNYLFIIPPKKVSSKKRVPMSNKNSTIKKKRDHSIESPVLQ